MKLIVYFFMIILSGCQYLDILEVNQVEIDSGLHEIFTMTFNDSECMNPCWMNIEVGVTTYNTVIAILEEHGIDYSVPGVISLHSIPINTVPGLVTEGVLLADGITQV